jgi:hypothetical protein
MTIAAPLLKLSGEVPKHPLAWSRHREVECVVNFSSPDRAVLNDNRSDLPQFRGAA